MNHDHRDAPPPAPPAARTEPRTDDREPDRPRPITGEYREDDQFEGAESMLPDDDADA